MNVGELIDQLNKVEDKNLIVELSVASKNESPGIYYGVLEYIKLNKDCGTLEFWNLNIDQSA